MYQLVSIMSHFPSSQTGWGRDCCVSSTSAYRIYLVETFDLLRTRRRKCKNEWREITKFVFHFISKFDIFLSVLPLFLLLSFFSLSLCSSLVHPIDLNISAKVQSNGLYGGGKNHENRHIEEIFRLKFWGWNGLREVRVPPSFGETAHN